MQLRCARRSISNKHMKQLVLIALAVPLLLAGCGKGKKPLVVGSKGDTEQTILGEIIAQHLENRLGEPVERRLGLGSTENLYQSLIGDEIQIYPEYTGMIETSILKEIPAQDAATVLQRVRNEMARVAQAAAIGPLGYENPPAMVVKASDAKGVDTLTQASEGTIRWKLGMTVDFRQRADGEAALNNYRLPMGAPVQAIDNKQLFPALDNGDVTMIAVTTTAGPLVSNKWKILADDKHAFPPEEAVILARQDRLNEDPRIRAALEELSGKISQATMRRLNSLVDVDNQPVRDVASGFLISAGLKPLN